MELTAQAPSTRIHGHRLGRGRRHSLGAGAHRHGPREVWDHHGGSAYELACALLGNEAAAAEAVRHAMSDLARSTGVVSDGEARRRLARTIYRHAQETAAGAAYDDRLPRSMAWLSRLARLQRASLALCVYGGLTHREAATLLDVPPATVAELITTGLREIGRLAAVDACA